MKILIFGLGKQEDICNAFAEHGDIVYWDCTTANGRFNVISRNLVDTHKPDLLFMQIQTPDIISIDTAKYLSSKTKVLNWTGDVRTPTPKWFFDIGRHIHCTYFSNMHDVEVLRASGINADYLQIGFPTEIFKPEGEKIQCPEIIFMGNNVGGFPLSKFRVDMVEALKARYHHNFGVYGINWGAGVHSIPEQVDEAKYYRNCKVAINLSHFDYSRYSSDRIFRLMGAGAFCLSHRYTDIEKDFNTNSHLITWANFSELFEKIDYYLTHDLERETIATFGCQHVHLNHNWNVRINELMKTI